jgi:hypothetical protein
MAETSMVDVLLMRAPRMATRAPLFKISAAAVSSSCSGAQSGGDQEDEVRAPEFRIDFLSAEHFII